MSIAALVLFIRTLSLTMPLWLVAGWSAAESAIFVIVADVPISWIAVSRGPKAALLAAFVAAIASVVGVLATWAWTMHDPCGIAATYAALPGIDRALIERAGSLYQDGPWTVLNGSFSGIPFKLFSMAAAERGDWWILPLAPFLRLPRFAAIAVLSGMISKMLSGQMSKRHRLGFLIVLWTVFYIFYWVAMAR